MTRRAACLSSPAHPYSRLGLAYPVSKLLSDAVGRQFLSTPLDYTFSISGVLIWLVVVIFLSALASFLPAWNASQLIVREVLAYE